MENSTECIYQLPIFDIAKWEKVLDIHPSKGPVQSQSSTTFETFFYSKLVNHFDQKKNSKSQTKTVNFTIKKSFFSF